jgi:glycosyltransferase involved in cell wall biosynthesis
MLEGFGLVAAEAMASGKATIVSRVAGISEYLTDGEDAVLLGELSDSALAAVISGLLQDEKRRRQIGVRARSTAESRFDWREIAGRILGEYERAALLL